MVPRSSGSTRSGTARAPGRSWKWSLASVPVLSHIFACSLLIRPFVLSTILCTHRHVLTLARAFSAISLQSSNSAPSALALPSTDLLPAHLSSSVPALHSTCAAIRKRYACPHCPLDFPKSGNRNRHIENKHPRELGKSKLECAFCGQRFWDSNKLNKHATQCQGTPAAAARLPPAASAENFRPTEPNGSPLDSAAQSTRVYPFNRSSLSTNDINQASTDFFAWLTEPPLPTEHMLRKVATPEAIAQQREAVRQLVREANVEVPALLTAGIQLRLLVVPKVVKAVITAM